TKTFLLRKEYRTEKRTGRGTTGGFLRKGGTTGAAGLTLARRSSARHTRSCPPRRRIRPPRSPLHLFSNRPVLPAVPLVLPPMSPSVSLFLRRSPVPPVPLPSRRPSGESLPSSRCSLCPLLPIRFSS